MKMFLANQSPEIDISKKFKKGIKHVCLDNWAKHWVDVISFYVRTN